jgi:predicted PurR-regulated permease PerM
MPDTSPPLDAPAPGPEQPPARTAGLPGIAIVAAVAVAALYLGREVLIPITLAMLLTFLLSPLVELLRRMWLGHILSALVAVVIALGVILVIGGVIGTQVAQLAHNVPQYQTAIEDKIGKLREATVGRVGDTLSNLRHRLAGTTSQPSAAPSGSPQNAGPQAQEQPPVPVVVTQPTPSALQIGEKVLPALSPLATAGIILVVTIFTLLQKEDLRDRAIRLLGSTDLHRTTVAMNDAGGRLTRYFLTQLGLNTAFGIIVGVGLYFVGVPNPILWGILGALFRFVPYIGSWIAAALPILLAAAVEPGWSMAIWTAALYVVTELVMGQAVEPLVYGHTTGLSPVAVIVAAIFWTWIWGPIGLIISTPVTLCLVVLGRHVEGMEFFDVLLGDAPVLTPVESFYQRILAGDPDEAEEHAERYLEDRPLSSYYDEVALKGLQLAAEDIVRGWLPRSKVARLKEAVQELVRDLDDYDDVAPSVATKQRTVVGPTLDEQAPPSPRARRGEVLDRSRLAPEWQGEAPVLCIAGRGPLDEVVSSMLAQLLGKHGLGARVVSHDAVSRATINSLDLRDVAMMCVSYVNISGRPAHLRYLLRRLRERQPRVPILVGLWPEDDPIMADEDLRAAMGADHYVSTLREAVERCVAAALPPEGATSRLGMADEKSAAE